MMKAARRVMGVVAIAGAVALLAGRAEAKQICARGDAFKAITANGFGVSGCAQVNNQSGGSVYTTWSCPGGATNAGIQVWFPAIPDDMDASATFTSVDVFYRSGGFTSKRVCFTSAVTVSSAGAIKSNPDTLRGFQDATGQESQGYFPAADFSTDANAEYKANLNFVPTFRAWQGKSADGVFTGAACSGGVCQSRRAIASLIRTALCTNNVPGANEILGACWYYTP